MTERLSGNQSPRREPPRGPRKPATTRRQPLPKPRLPGQPQIPPPPAAGTGQPSQRERRTSSLIRDENKPTRRHKEPENVVELAELIVRHAVKHDAGLTTAVFDKTYLPRAHLLADGAVRDPLITIAHALYVAIVLGRFSNRPVLCGVRAAELAADLIERVLNSARMGREAGLLAVRCANLLVGLTFNAVRLIECTSLSTQPLRGFTDYFERAVITAYGLKTQAEATGLAPWFGRVSNPLDQRIGRAINTMSGVFGEYISKHAETMDDEQYNDVLREFDSFMDRFAPYIEGGRPGAEERRKRLTRGEAAQGLQGDNPKVEPLEIKELRERPAGIEIVTTDGRILFVATEDARRIGKAADNWRNVENPSD